MYKRCLDLLIHPHTVPDLSSTRLLANKLDISQAPTASHDYSGEPRAPFPSHSMPNLPLIIAHLPDKFVCHLLLQNVESILD
jgi:hypothetical protein